MLVISPATPAPLLSSNHYQGSKNNSIDPRFSRYCKTFPGYVNYQISPWLAALLFPCKLATENQMMFAVIKALLSFAGDQGE